VLSRRCAAAIAPADKRPHRLHLFNKYSTLDPEKDELLQLETLASYLAARVLQYTLPHAPLGEVDTNAV